MTGTKRIVICVCLPVEIMKLRCDFGERSNTKLASVRLRGSTRKWFDDSLIFYANLFD